MHLSLIFKVPQLGTMPGAAEEVSKHFFMSHTFLSLIIISIPRHWPPVESALNTNNCMKP